MSGADPIAAFWRWWTKNRVQLERAISDGTLRTWVDPVSRLARAVDPRLDWEFGKGKRAQHYFCLSAKGDPEVRVIAERWRSAGPADDAVFEFYASRPGTGGAPFPIVFDDVTFDVSEVRVLREDDDARARMHLRVWHPAFASIPERLRRTATFLALDGVLGEDEVERWIGGIELLERAPDGGIALDVLGASLDALRARDHDRIHTLLEAALPDGRPLIVAADLRLKRVDHLLMDTHVEAQLSLRDAEPNGLPTRDELARLRDAEQRLDSLLGHDAVFVARETGGAKRTTHFHVAETGPALPRVDAWASEIEWAVEVRVTRDPAWSILRRW